MESCCGLRLTVSLLCVCALFTHGEAVVHERVIDLLAALNITHPTPGISRVQTSSTVVYKIRPRAPYMTLPQKYSHVLTSDPQAGFCVRVEAQQTSGTNGSLFSISSASTPFLQVISSTVNNTLRLDYLAGDKGLQGSVSSYFPKRNPFSEGGWVRLAVCLQREHVTLYVECEDPAVLATKSNNKTNLFLPRDVSITLASTPGRKDSKFNGYLKQAEISLKIYQQRPWTCSNMQDTGSQPQHSQARSHDSQTDNSRETSSSGLQTNLRLHEQNRQQALGIQSDQQHRGWAFGSSGSPQGEKPAAQALREDQLRMLEQKLEELVRMMDVVKAQNTELESRLKYLEGCECVRRGCVTEGREVPEGHRWQTDIDTVCSCTSGEVVCQRITQTSRCEPDGRVHNVSYTTVDGCQTYECKDNNCSPTPCHPQDCAQKTPCKASNEDCSPAPCHPQDCKPDEPTANECAHCTHNGIQYNNGAQWRSAENPCDICYCVEGHVHCQREQCDTPCKKNPSPAAPADACCSACSGCVVNGLDYPDGARVPTSDQCQECACVNGKVECSGVRCPAVLCRNPVHHPGDCCPRCDHCEYESQAYVNGQKFSSNTDPCVQCRCTDGEVSCERTDSSCPTPRCSHPARRKGECCPTCSECEYDRSVYPDGKSFRPAGSGPCLQCRCKAGNVMCHEEKCPPVVCSNPIREPHQCCPTCRACVSNGREYDEGSTWRPDGPCSSCTCVNGEVVCTHTRCPPNSCLHPTKSPSSCCASCDRCTYNDRIYSHGQSFSVAEQPCHSCTCLSGTVECERRACPPVPCTDPHTPPGDCCPKCPDCSYENRVLVDGDAFPNPANVCEECNCVSGRIDCHQTQCPPPRCNAPRPGTCCHNNCNGCSHTGKEYHNGEEFPHPTDPCRTCTCLNGNVQCLMRRCPPLSCSSPTVVLGECCPQCPTPPSDCVYEQRTYRNTERFLHPTDGCRSCTCNNGAVHCQRKPCPFASCLHPVTRDCCRTCDGCLYEGGERANGESWEDPSDSCSVCVCREGSVSCERRRCPPANCKHPVQRECCLSCDGCFYDNKLLLDGESVPEPGSLCTDCVCQRGSVRCEKRSCPPVRCPHPAFDQCGCPVCDGCYFQDVTFADGQTLRGDQSCQDCRCSRGDVVCTPRSCPDVSCTHPALDVCSCAVCDGCNFEGRNFYNGERFSHPTDRCQHCSCFNGGVVCQRNSCLSVSCRHPVTPPGECCPVCTGTCFHHGREHQSGSTFVSASDPCSSCSCLNGVVNCQRRPCPVQCSHPVPSDVCCPLCDSCLYEGVVTFHGQMFTRPSSPCERCTCVRGSVTCERLVCPPTHCAQPVSRPGQCCPECPVAACLLEGQAFTDGQTWPMRSNPCSTCICQTGEVQCSSPQCPKLSCWHTVTDPGSCCPRCRGCRYGEEEYPEGSSWFADSTPCMSCMCVGGVTTCSEVQCLSPCVNVITVPGECCPVCADCIFEGRVYSPGESFYQADDPCQICTCEVMPDGEQHLRCYRKQCPSLVDCPKSNILFSGPDSCCPVCAQPLSNCTAALIGNEILATDDPCFTCHCKDLTWTCLHQSCPPLTCPPSQQVSPADSCCPVCKDCVIEGQNRHVINGTSWTDSDDDCVKCTCNLGSVECSIEECPPVVCLRGQKQVKIPGKCCFECEDSNASLCLHQGAVYHSNEQWEVDQCTSCTCVSGDVHCHSERCPALTCATDEMPAVIPGLCCPHCLPRPATCIAFGDPHYRTFDGRMLHFQGTCTYVLAQDCGGGDFSIYVTNEDRGRQGVSWTKEVTVLLGDVTVQLLQAWVVKVNDEVVTLPFLREPYIYIERQTNTILLNTNIGLKVLWSLRSHLEVSVPGSYKGNTCGLCGNFNGFHQDDLRTRNGRISISEAEFGNSWKVSNSSHSVTSCRPGEDVDPCKDAGYQAKKGANARCKVLKSSVFRPCHRVVPPESWYAACVYDLCACGANSDECLCDTLEAYASQCRAAGVRLQWRSAALCAVGCPVERGFVFDECGPPCPVTCFNMDVPLGVIESHCFKPCVPGCQCPAGLVLHNNYCIQPEKCPKIIHDKS
ncbi:kielin/chordin-like protein isoform X2 [Gouania willdenowi]|uniref:kielin/chordin-like protein isoform X2 n=1 Tax=Gouania willdenowi TaxID=441366 RepID=UPI0010562281|nr:kielin/chordin-like protein isoform X2 [Gouania willdenowi]